MHFVHSLWSKPLIVSRRNVALQRAILVNIFSAAASYAWIKHNGGKMDLYCDGFSKDTLEFIPYDHIYELKVPNNVPTACWAVGKFLTLEKMELGDVHIDNDVYIKGDEIFNKVLDTSYDVVVQSTEDDKTVQHDYYDNIRTLFNNYNIKPLYCTIDDSISYNCGTIGFNNQELKMKYLKEYFYTLNQIIHNKDVVNILKNDKNSVPDLVLEQQFLYELSRDYKVNNLLGTSDELYDNALKYNYQHVLGGYKEEAINSIINELKYVDEDLFRKAMKQASYLM